MLVRKNVWQQSFNVYYGRRQDVFHLFEWSHINWCSFSSSSSCCSVCRRPAEGAGQVLRRRDREEEAGGSGQEEAEDAEQLLNQDAQLTPSPLSVVNHTKLLFSLLSCSVMFGHRKVLWERTDEGWHVSCC